MPFKFLSSIFSASDTTTKKFLEADINSNVDEFAKWLQDQTPESRISRLWVEAGSSYGHQSSSVNLLYRLVRPIDESNLNFGYNGIVEVYYEDKDGELNKLKQLIPELEGKDCGKINNAEVKLIKYTAPPSSIVNFGFSGGTSVTESYAAKLNVNYFLRLQPYNWEGKEEIQFLKTDKNTINLAEVPSVGGTTFKRRLYFTDPALYKKPPWETYLGGNYSDQDKGKLKIVRYLTSDHFLSKYALQTAYSIKTGAPRFNQNTPFGAAVISAAVLEWQKPNGVVNSYAKPTVIINFDEFGTDEESAGNDLKSILDGGFAKDESMFKLQVERNIIPAKTNFERRSKYFKSLDSTKRFFYLNYPSDISDVEGVLTLIENKPDCVLFVQLGRSFPAIFSHALYKSTLPPIFEGQNTANLAINIGKPYVQIPASNATAEQRLAIYPSVTLSNYSSDKVPENLVNIAGNVSSAPSVWPDDQTLAPPVLMGSYYDQYTRETSAKEPIKLYFSKIKEFFSSASQDKFTRAVTYLNILRLEDTHKTIAVDDNPLDSLYKKLHESIEQGSEVDLIPGILSKGNISDFIQHFLKDFAPSLKLDVTKLEPNTATNPLTKVTLIGTTDVFNKIGVTNEIIIVFTAPKNSLTAELTITANETWSMQGAPWIQFTNPYISFIIPSKKLPVLTTIGGYYPGLESQTPSIIAKLEIAVGGDENYWPASIEFSENYPNISNAYQMVTGFNLVQNLPEPFNILTDLAIKNVDILYDYTNKTINSLAIIAQSNTSNLVLFGDLKLNNIIVSSVVITPLTTRELTFGLSAEFGIGKSNPAIVSVSFNYPDIVLKGALKSGIITLSKLLETFLPNVNLLIPHEPQIDEFEFIYNKQSNYLSVNMHFIMPSWDFTFPYIQTPLFSLDTIRFGITRKKNENSGFITAHTTLLPNSQAPIGVDIGAFYEGDSNWRFNAHTTSDIDTNTLLQEYMGDNWVSDAIDFPPINDVEVTLMWGKNDAETANAQAFSFKAKTAEQWLITPLNLSLLADVTIGYNSSSHSIGNRLRMSKAEMPVLIYDGTAKGLEILETEPVQAGSYGQINAEIIWNNIDLLVSYNFAPEVQSFEVTWGILTGKIEEKLVEGKKCQIATLAFTQSTTLGSMIEIMVSWATGSKFSLSAPWNVLDKITLSDFELVYNFTDETVEIKVNIGPIDLGFVTINSIGLSYEKSSGNASEKSVMIDLDAKFIWGETIPKWDVTKPETAPSPEGSGNKYLDLRMLAMGQHITFNGFKDATTVQKAIALMANMPEPKSDEIPAITFDADSSWLFAADFGVLKVEGSDKYTFNLQTIFNDPNLYALRIALDKDAPAAKIFKGLDFQIMYRKLTDSLGVYQSEITLPDAMRHLTVGAYSITLPVFGIEIYTNGDFKVDIGFPWNEDFSRSFTVEAIVPPGIPLTGSGGLYFGKIPQVVANVPVTTKGHFNPILVLGFGAQVGLGKSIQYGILKAGFSLTVFGILEGLLAKWNPYVPSTGTGSGSDMQVQGEYYFNIQGTFGVIGKVYGSVDFAIIKADVNITIKLFAQITFASYQPIPISVVASVDATASLKIDLGLFSIRVHFSFSVKVKETFVIGALQNPEDAPWLDKQQGVNGRLLSPLNSRLRDHNLALNLNEVSDVSPVWSRLKTPVAPAVKSPLEAFLTFAPTVAGDNAFTIGEAPDKSKQVPCYISSIFIKSIPAATNNDNTSALKADGEVSDSSFEVLAKMIARWAVSSIQDSDVSIADVDALVVSDDSLKALLTYLEGTTEQPVPLPYVDIEAFLTNQFKMKLSLPNSTTEASEDATFFPMVLPLTLNVPAYEDSAGKTSTELNYRFDQYNSLSPDFISWLRDYFNQLSVQVENESDQTNPNNLSSMLLDDGISLAQFVFSDYFTLIMKQMVQAMLEGLRSFKYSMKPNDTANSIVTWVNNTGRLNEQFQLHDLFEANADHRLNEQVNGSGVALVIPNVIYSSIAGDSFTAIAAKAEFNGSFNAKSLATKNALKSGILTNGQTITYPNKTDYKVESSVTLQTIADKIFAVSLDDLLDNSNILANENLLLAFSPLTLPNVNYYIRAGDTLNSIASVHGIDVETLSIIENGEINDLFDSTENPYLDLVHLPQFQVGELIKEAQRTKAIEQLSGMASRYYLHGLRLPTDKIMPNKEGMWVTKKDNTLSLPSEAGLFALTGQQFSVPALVEGKPLDITISRSDSLSWLTFDNDNDSLTYTLKTGESNYQSIQALHQYASQNALNTGLKSLGALSMVDSDASTYPLSSSIVCQTEASIDYPIGGGVEGQSRLFYLPDAMQSLSSSEQSDFGVLPDFALQVHRYNEATGTSGSSNIKHYGWATSLEFSIKRLPSIEDENDSAYNETYEIIGADGNAALLLEKMALIDSDDDIAFLSMGYTIKSGSDSAFRIATGDDITIGVSQSNLSTTTRPPSLRFAEDIASTTESNQPILLNNKVELIQSLWKASITRNGGFYLYFNQKDEAGLPDIIFNNQGEASLSLFVLYDESNVGLHPYMNAALIGDPINSSTGSVIAKAISSPLAYTVLDTDSAKSIVAKHYSSLLSLAQSNPNMTLSTGANCTLVNGTFQVPQNNASPGGNLSDIAAYFDIDTQAIKDINPRVDWTTDLLIGQAIRLPQINLTIGTSPGGTGLQEIADFYGTSSAAILGENLSVSGLISAEQELDVVKGPFMQSGTEMPGVQAIGANRLALPEPLPPTDPNYAENYLLNLYTLLGYRINQNQDFINSKIGLPLGPKGESSSDGMGKIRSVKPMNEVDLIAYSKGLPYVELISDINGHTETVSNPYQANGRLLQIDYSWNDLYGNRLVTQLDEGSLIGNKVPNAPVLTGYTDTLVGLAQWPGTSSHWTVAKDTLAPDNFLLDVTISFDPSPYDKPISGNSDSWQTRAKTALITFNKLIAQLTDPNGISISFKTGLLLSKVLLPESIIGTPLSPTSTLLGWLTGIQAFLVKRASGDSTNTAVVNTLSLNTSIPKSELNPGQIFVIDFEFIIKRTNGIAEGDFAAMPAVREIATQVTPLTETIKSDGTQRESSNDNQGLDQFAKDIEEILSKEGEFSLTIGTGKDRSIAKSYSSKTTIWAVRLGDNSEQGMSFSINEYDHQSNKATPQIFSPRPVLNKLKSGTVEVYPYSTPDDFDITTDNFSTTPISLNFTDIDLDNWLRQFFTSIDNLLSPEYLSSILVIDQKTQRSGANSFITSFGKQKTLLANVAKTLMSAVYKEQESSLVDSAQEALYQQLLEKLSNLYSTRAAISYSSNVNADAKVNCIYDDPQLYGNIAFKDASTDNSQFVLTSPKLTLKTDNAAPLTFMVEASALPTSTDAGVLSSLALDLKFEGAAIEHQISDINGVDNYKASSWLGLVGTKTKDALHADLGEFEMPIFIRSFPATPRMDLQSGKPYTNQPGELSLADLTAWNYSFSYSQDYHFAQDRVYGEIEYNLTAGRESNLTANLPDAFDALAQFINAKPQLEKLLNENIPLINAQTSDVKQIEDAAKVLAAFLKMVNSVTAETNSASELIFNQPMPKLTGNDDLKYEFHIEEGSYKFIPTGNSTEITAWVVKIVSSSGKPPVGLLPGQHPVVKIPGFDHHSVPDNTPLINNNPDKGVYAFWYSPHCESLEGRDCEPLEGSDAQVIKRREVVIEGLNILQRQDAKSNILLKRNEELIPGKPSADDFVYQTPQVSFTNSLVPTIDHSIKFDISTIPSTTESKTLANYLGDFFKALFSTTNNTSTQTIQLECQYAYSLTDGLDKITLPVLMLPPTVINPESDFDVPQGGCPSHEQTEIFICELSNKILSWFNHTNPSTREAVFNFDLTVMSDLTEQPMPLIRLRSLYLSVKLANQSR